MTLRKLIAEPLTHFVLFGGALFLAYRLLNADAMQAPSTIVVPQAQVEALARQHELTWQRRPSPVELRAMIDSWVRDEILFREGLAAGADRDDPVVRRRVVQKMQYLFEDMATEVPTDSELQAWLDANRADYRVPAVYSLEQVFLGELPRGPAGQAVVAGALAALRGGRAAPVQVASVLPASVELTHAGGVERMFGREFVHALHGLPLDAWSGPVRSAYGSHLVRLSRRDDARDPALAEVRQQVVDDVQRHRREAQKEALFASLRKRYTVEIAPPPVMPIAAAAPVASADAAPAGSGDAAP